MTAFVYILPALFFIAILIAAVRRVKVYDSFAEGIKGAVPLVKSAHPQRMRDNAAVFSFTLSKEQMERLENLPYKSGWSGEHPDTAIPLCPPEKHYL